MVVVPRESPALSNLNSYYLKLDKLIEHCQGEMGAGGIFLRSLSAQGVVYFDADEVLNGYFCGKNTELHGQAAVEHLVQADFNHNFTIDIYRLSRDTIYLWSRTPAAEKVYKDLSTEFTDLDGLIKKMAAERLDGFIDITIGAAQEGGILFFGGGDIVGGSFSWGPVHRESVAALRRRLVEKTKKQGGVFQVCRISLDKAQDASMPPAATDEAPRHVLRMLEEFLVIFETFYNGRREKGADFNSLIRKKFVDNAERFAFLDPFAGEFDFSERRIRFSGEAADRELATGIIVSTIELAREIGVEQELRKYLSSWRRKYDETLARLDVHIA